MNTFSYDYSRTLVNALSADLRDNYDIGRFGPLAPKKRNRRERLSSALAAFGISTLGAKAMAVKQTESLMTHGLDFVKPHLTELEWLYSELADDESRQWLVSLAAYRALGHRKIRLPINAAQFSKAKEIAKIIPHGDEEIDPGFLGWKFHERSLEKFGYPIRMFTGPSAYAATFYHQQYRCETAKGVIEAALGDVVVDAGGCYGDTALYFAQKVGPDGLVASFEFVPSNVSIFERNMKLNPELRSRITLYENPVYSTTDKELFVVGSGPGTQVLPTTADPSARKVFTIRIDDLIKRGCYSRVDFIKMDIEGAELEALKGSETVLRSFKPKVAIAVYHYYKDFWEIPRYLKSLDLGYHFYLRHFTNHAEETVLFGISE